MEAEFSAIIVKNVSFSSKQVSHYLPPEQPFNYESVVNRLKTRDGNFHSIDWIGAVWDGFGISVQCNYFQPGTGTDLAFYKRRRCRLWALSNRLHWLSHAVWDIFRLYSLSKLNGYTEGFANNPFNSCGGGGGGRVGSVKGGVVHFHTPGFTRFSSILKFRYKW